LVGFESVTSMGEEAATPSEIFHGGAVSLGIQGTLPVT